MIEFACQHCGNRMRTEPEYAGRDACCKVCGRLIVIPHAGGVSADVFALPIEERCRRTELMLQYTATKLQQCRAMLLPYRDAQGELIPPDRLRESGPDANELEALRAARGALEAQMASLRIALRESQDRLDEAQAARASNERRIEELESAFETMRKTADAEEQELQAARVAREKELENDANLLRYELEYTGEELYRLRAERARIEDNAAQVERLETELAAATARIAEFERIFEMLGQAGFVEGGGADMLEYGPAVLEDIGRQWQAIDASEPAAAHAMAALQSLLDQCRAWAAMQEQEERQSLALPDLPEEEAPESDPMAQAYLRFLKP